MTPPSASRTAVIVVAAGSGTRLGSDAPKAFVTVGGRTILRHALGRVRAADPAEVVVVAPSSHVAHARDEAAAADVTARVVAGGSTRQASVAAGLAALGDDVDVVLVHDAARAFAPTEVFLRVADAVRATGDGVIAARPVVDTLKRVDAGVVVAPVDRAQLAAAQTPQGFPYAALRDAYARADADHTDDAALFAAAGGRVHTVAGDELSFKITVPADLARAEALLAPTPAAPRVGVGTDVHAFGGDDPLWLAGLEWPGEQGLRGHSDGDAVAHAIVDAVLAAAGLGDIGTHFGTDRPEFAGAHADAFLARTREILATAGWRVGNVSVQVQANRPRFAARRAEAEAALTAALGAPVSVSATTTDGLGFTGVGDGVAAFAVAVVSPA